MNNNKNLKRISELIQQKKYGQVQAILESEKTDLSLAQQAEFNHLLGVHLYQDQQTILGIEWVLKAVNLLPNHFLFHCNLTEMYRKLGDLERAIHHGKTAIQLNQSHVNSFTNLGIAFFDQEEYEEAIAMHQKALSINPRCLPSLNNIGSIYHKQRNFDEAIVYFNQVFAIDPNYIESLNNMGSTYTAIEDFPNAKKYLVQVIKSIPNHFEAISNLANVFLNEKNFHQAELLFRKSLQINPHHLKALLGLATTLHEADFKKEALALLDEASHNNDDDLSLKLAEYLHEANDHKRSKAILNEILQHKGDHKKAHLQLANMAIEEGDATEATEHIMGVLQDEPQNTAALCAYINNTKITKGDEYLSTLQEFNNTQKIYSSDEKISISYALGKAYDDLKEFDSAFHYFNEGANLKNEKLDYNPKEETEFTDRIMQAFSKENLKKFKAYQGHKTDQLIFILGMPRSGTTLTEQIIASHPRVHGAGELSFLMDALKEKRLDNISFPENFLAEPQQIMTKVGDDYLKQVKQLNFSEDFVTDKMPNNFHALGAIHLIFPHAKIIHTRRDPLDTCLSNFTRLFRNNNQPASYNLSNLAQMYRDYYRLMQHWRDVLPAGSFYEIDYESLVNDMDEEAKKLIDYCQLEWDESCLEFYKLKRPVKTASVNQVRKPIYKTSMARWKNYDKYLNDLKNLI